MVKQRKKELDKNLVLAQKQLNQARQQVELAEGNGLNVTEQKAQLEKTGK